MTRLALLLVLASCRTATPVVSAAVPADTAQPSALLPPATDLNGGWFTGTGEEPQVPVIVLHPVCAVVPAVWLVEQKGNAVRAWAFPEQFNQGVMRRNDNVARIEPATGTISGTDVRLDDGTWRYALVYDSASEHLRGTRNGARFWAVRQKIVRTEFCLPPPE